MVRSGQDGLSLRIAGLKGRLALAERRAGREAGSTRILYATKYASAQQVAALASLEPAPAIGENRMQEARVKFGELLRLVGPARFASIEKHFIGNLQSNKVRDAVSLFGCVQSVSSLSLAQKISRCAEEAGREISVYIEVNNGEAGKQGARADEVGWLALQIRALPSIRLEGLMGIGIEGDPQATREFFRALRQQADSLGLKTSMGMSDDFEIAAEEGSDWVRLGRAVFESANGK